MLKYVVLLQKILCVALLFCALATSEAFADNSLTDSCHYKINGKVSDSLQGSTLPDAVAFLQPGDVYAIVNPQGNFTFKGLCAGNYSLTISHIGCKPVIKQISIGTQNITVKIVLFHFSTSLKEVDIISTTKGEGILQPSSSLSKETLESLAGLSLGESLKSIAGVNAIQTGSSVSKPVIHGLSGSRVVMLNNGVRQEGQQWGNEHAPEIDPFAADEITVIKGPGTVKYGGEAAGGVIITKPINYIDTIGLHGKAQAVGISNGRLGAFATQLQHRISKSIAYRVQGSYRRGGDVHTPDATLKNTGLAEKNSSAAIQYKLRKYTFDLSGSNFFTQIGIYDGSHIGNLSDLQNTLAGKRPPITEPFTYKFGRPYQEVNHSLVKLNINRIINEKSNVDLQIARQDNHRKEYDKHLPLNNALAKRNLPELDLNIETYTADFLYKNKIKQRLQSQIGLNATHQANVYSGRDFIPNYYKNAIGVFALEKYVGDNYTLEAGLRGEFQNYDVYRFARNEKVQNDKLYYTNYSASLAASKVIGSFSYLLSTTFFERSPNINELYSNGLHHGAAAIEQGNRALKPEQGLFTSLSAEPNFTDTRISVQWQLYYNRYFNYIYLRPLAEPIVTVRGAFPSFMFQQARADIAGADLSLQYKIIPTRLHLVSTASALYANNYTENKPLIYMPAPRMQHTINYYSGTTRVFVGNVTVARQTRTPSGEDYAPAPAAYTLFETGFEKQIFKKHNNLKLSFKIYNIFASKYRDYLDRFRYYTDAPGRSFELRFTAEF